MKKERRNALYVIFITSVVRGIIAALTGLGTGEAYYTRGLKELQLSYFDQPPLFFWVSKASTLIFGLNNFGVRFPSILFFAGSCWLLFKLTEKIYDAKAAFYAVIVANIAVVFTVPVAVWFQPDASLIFFWMLTLYISYLLFFEKAGARTNLVRWCLLGLAGGLGMLSKYHTALLILGIAAYVMIIPSQRKYLKTPGPYLATLIALLCASPVFIWNAQHDWISFLWQGSRSVGEPMLHPEWLLRSVVGQMLWLAPWVWAIMVIAAVKERKYVSHEKRQFLYTMALPVIFIFTMISLWSDTQFHFHWQAPGYITLMVFAGGYLSRHRDKKWLKNWWKLSFLFTLLIPLLLFHAEYGFLNTGFTRQMFDKFNNGTDPSIDGKDFLAIRDRFEKEGWLADTNLFVASTKWHKAGKIDWALKLQKDVVILSGDVRNYAYLIDPVKWLGKDAVVVTLQDDGGTYYSRIRPFFLGVEKMEPIYIERAGMKELKFSVMYCRHFRVPKREISDMPVYRQLTGHPPY